MARVLKYFAIILIPIVIILGNLKYLATNMGFYQSLYKKVGVYTDFQDANVVDGATSNLIGYFRGKNQLDHNFFSTQATAHLRDVHDLLILTSGLFYLSAIALFGVGVFLISRGQSKIILQSLVISSIVTIIFIATLGLGVATAFDSLFFKFHQLLFTNTLWLFPADDNLIRLFPQQFFVEFANQLAANIFVTSSIIAVSSFVLKKQLTRPKYLILNT